MADTLTAYTTARARFERKASRASMPCASVRAGVTLPLELVGGGEPVPVGAGQVEGESEAGRGHTITVATDASPGHVNRPTGVLTCLDATEATP